MQHSSPALLYRRALAATGNWACGKRQFSRSPQFKDAVLTRRRPLFSRRRLLNAWYRRTGLNPSTVLSQTTRHPSFRPQGEPIIRFTPPPIRKELRFGIASILGSLAYIWFFITLGGNPLLAIPWWVGIPMILILLVSGAFLLLGLRSIVHVILPLPDVSVWPGGLELGGRKIPWSVLRSYSYGTTEFENHGIRTLRHRWTFNLTSGASHSFSYTCLVDENGYIDPNRLRTELDSRI